MKKFIVPILLACVFWVCQPESKNAGQLWPKIQPYKTGYLRVSDLHEIYYQLGGNPQAQPVMVLHSGPGAGCSSADFRYFNPKKFHIILHDQRGASQSKPFAELMENTTWDLVADIEKLWQHLSLGQIILFGGSWGSTLALAYSEKYPENVAGMILRGIFTATRAELDHYYLGGTGLFFPEAYQQFLAHIEHPTEKNYAAQLLTKMSSPDTLIQKKTAAAWARYEGKIAFLEVADEFIENWLQNHNPIAFSRIENYYMANNCFFYEGQLFNEAEKLAQIPIILVNGRYDMICPPITAYKLHQKLPKSKLYIVERAGHSANDPGIEQKLVEAVREFE